MMGRVGWWALACGVASLLGGCAPAQEDLQQWMTEQRRQMVPKVTPLAEPKKYVPQDYTQTAAVDPFGHERLAQALRRESGVKGSGDSLIAPELNRRKEPLEAYPLDTVKMVGSLNKTGVPTALVSVDKLLYQVRTGNYLGQNYGKITKITENSIQLREIVQDGGGDWIERTSTLELQEVGK